MFLMCSPIETRQKIAFKKSYSIYVRDCYSGRQRLRGHDVCGVVKRVSFMDTPFDVWTLAVPHSPVGSSYISSPVSDIINPNISHLFLLPSCNKFFLTYFLNVTTDNLCPRTGSESCHGVHFTTNGNMKKNKNKCKATEINYYLVANKKSDFWRPTKAYVLYTFADICTLYHK